MTGLEGTTFGSYHLTRLLGEGGMAAVYLAYDEATDRDVAIKVIGGSNINALERFRREAEAIDKLHHDHILSVFDYDDQEPWHYLVMLYASGGTLSDRLQGGPLTLDDAGEMLDQIADALQFAHDHGVIHRDLKPSNILLRDRHYAYLADFGLAKVLTSSGEITQSGTIMGTPEYMAPDLAQGPATKSSDIYALGVLLYRMITGRVPFSGDTPIAVYWKQMHEQPMPPSVHNPDISPAIDRVLLRALEKDPRKRYQTARELAEAYRVALSEPQEQVSQVVSQVLYAEAEVADWQISQSSRARPAKARRPARTRRGRTFARRSGHAPASALPPLPPRSTEMSTTIQEWIEAPAPVRRNGGKVAMIIVAGLLAFVVLPIAAIYALYVQHASAQTGAALQGAYAARRIGAVSQMRVAQIHGPASMPTPGAPMLTDSLANNSAGRWADNGVTCYFAGAAYHVSVRRDNAQQSCALVNGSASNVSVQVDVSLLSGSYAGMLLRSRGDQFYLFGINNQGQFFFSRHDAGAGANYVPIIKATSSSVILPGSEKNTLLVIAHQDSFNLFINGAIVGQVQDGMYAYGQFALAAGTLPGTFQAEATFTNFKMSAS